MDATLGLVLSSFAELGAALVVVVTLGALAGCSPPTVADACRNVCACEVNCGLGDLGDAEARCDADGAAGEEEAAAAGCAAQYDAFIACVYTASCKELTHGCDGERDALLRCYANAAP
jgi:hypothetical protein